MTNFLITPLAMLAAAAGVALGPALPPAAEAQSTAVADVYYVQNASHRLWRLGPDYVPHDTTFTVAADTSPASVQVGTRTAVVFKRDADGLLWELRNGRAPQRLGNGLGLAPGTRPASAAVGDYVVTAFAGDSGGSLWWVSDAEPFGHFTGITMLPGTSPAIAATNSGAGFEIVFTRASDGLLWQYNTLTGPHRVGNGLGVATGTSPAVASANAGAVEIAFQAPNTGELWYVDEHGTPFNTQLLVAPGTSPAIAPKTDGSNYEIVFKNKADGLLWRLDPGFDLRYAANGLGVAPNTSPSIARMTDGTFAIAFNAAGFGDLWVVDANNVGHDTGVSMQPGTTPAIAANCENCVVPR
ncbi:hypothetical protein ACQPZX_06930 [Actinoplanes sp. CA-142083]|uniref:hypothetical protein n=1 Tax=Actinoplanes sp. CA-142083 TaxID=3239903 RepID=UPI003D8FB3DC